MSNSQLTIYKLHLSLKPAIFSLLLVFLLFTFYFLLSPTVTHAACAPSDWKCVIGGVQDPTGVPGTTGDEQLSNFVSRIIELIYIVAALVFAFMIIFGAFQWITSGGDKEALAKAKGRITHAIIGFVLLALSFVLINIIGTITGINILKNGGFQRPGFGQTYVCPPGQFLNPQTGQCS